MDVYGFVIIVGAVDMWTKRIHPHPWCEQVRFPPSLRLFLFAGIHNAVDNPGTSYPQALLIPYHIPYVGYFIYDHPYMGVHFFQLSDEPSNKCAYSPQAGVVFHSFPRLIHKLERFSKILSKQIPPDVALKWIFWT
jgi:hypothetical protein